MLMKVSMSKKLQFGTEDNKTGYQKTEALNLIKNMVQQGFKRPDTE